jgi:hypothetical protein
MNATDTREELYKKLPKNATVVEIGTMNAENAVKIINNSNPKILHLIDPNIIDLKNPPSRLKDPKQASICRVLKNSSINLIEDYSVPASKQFEDNSVDWIYIDGDHSYEFVKADLAYWLPKIKKGGYICGHDFNPFFANWKGVNQALYEFVVKYVEKDLDLFDKYKNDSNVFEQDSRTPPELLDVLDKHVEYSFLNWHDDFDKSDMTREHIWLAMRMLGKIDPVQLVERSDEAACVIHDMMSDSINRSFKLKVGDWVDDLNFDEIIRDAQLENPPKGLEKNNADD